jgi:galactose oxidase
MRSGDGQNGIVGQPLANPLVVLVTDEAGDPVEGVSVQWDPQGAGTVSAETVETGSDGQASVERVLGPEPGEQTTTASVDGLEGSPVTFLATANAATGGIVIATNPPVSALNGEVFDPAVQPVLLVTDGSGDPVVGIEVSASVASGGGTLEGNTSATTDAGGVARFGDLGIRGSGSHTLEFTAGTASVISSPVSLSPLPSEATTGEWGPVVEWDIVPLHMNLLPNGKILAWGKRNAVPVASSADTMGLPRIWDPATGPPSGLPEIAVDSMLFCAGHSILPDGRILVAGGHIQDDHGIAVTEIFSQDGVRQPGPSMAHARWYPTLTTLPDGRILAMGGRDENNDLVTTPEIFDGVQWVELTGAGTLNIPYYPRNFVAPDGRIFYAGERITSRWFNVNGAGSWTDGPNHIWPFNRDYGTAVMYEPGKILYAGGGGHTGWGQSPDADATVPTATAEIIDLNQGSPAWQNTSPMSVPRRHLNSTILPDGQVLITGGTRGGGFVNIVPGNETKAAEIWNPATGEWTTLASNAVTRTYHSVSLLLPDGTVLHGASGNAQAIQPGGGIVDLEDENSHEIFSPPYLFKGTRPAITSAPSTVGYGETFTVATPNAAQITDVRWIRLASVTHAFDMNQRVNTLTFTRTSTGLEVTAPASPNLAPPGHYQLFILNRNGVPSAGKVVRIGG